MEGIGERSIFAVAAESVVVKPCEKGEHLFDYSVAEQPLEFGGKKSNASSSLAVPQQSTADLDCPPCLATLTIPSSEQSRSTQKKERKGFSYRKRVISSES